MVKIIKYACLFFAAIIGCISCDKSETEKKTVIDLTKNCQSSINSVTKFGSLSNADMYIYGLYNHLDL